MEGDSLTQRFKALEAKKTPSDMALAELKQKMGLLPAASAPKALPQNSTAKPDGEPKANNSAEPKTDPPSPSST